MSDRRELRTSHRFTLAGKAIGEWVDNTFLYGVWNLSSSLRRIFRRDHPVFLNWDGPMEPVYWGADLLWWKAAFDAPRRHLPQVVVTFGHPQITDQDIHIALDSSAPHFPELVTEAVPFYRSQRGMVFFDGDLARVSRWDETTRCLTFQGVSFFDFLRSNLALDHPRPPLPTLRQSSLYQGTLQSFEASTLANATGVNGLLFTEDGYMVYQVRNNRVIIRPNQACSAFSGFVDRADIEKAVSSKRKGKRTLADVDRVRELLEEVGIKAAEIKGHTFLGLTRELHRGGMPELFYAVDVALSKQQVLERDHRDDEGAICATDFGRFARRAGSLGAARPTEIPPLEGFVARITEATGASISIPLFTNLVLWYRTWAPELVGHGAPRASAAGDA